MSRSFEAAPAVHWYPDDALLSKLLGIALSSGGSYADIFCERRVANSFRLQESRIHEAGITVNIGVGIRVIIDDRAGYGYTDDLSPDALERAARVAALIASDGGSAGAAVALREVPVRSVYDFVDHLPDSRAYVDLLERADVAARRHDHRIAAVNAFCSEELQEVVIATSAGARVADHRPLVTLGVQVVAKDKSERGHGYYGDGGRTGIEFYTRVTPEFIAGEAARIAATNLDAIETPAGEMTVVVGPGGGGVLLHEAVGHGLESDFNRQGTSLYSGRIGERVASELVTIYDDGDIHAERGSVAVDDEGNLGRHKVLVERGILRAYMQDHLNGSLMGSGSSGSGRRQSFRVMPQPRMCNTFMPSGESTAEEIVQSVKRGVYAKSFAGGQVDISKGDFVFMVAEGYLIEDGKLTAPLRGASLIGNGPEVMTRVVAVGNDSRLANGSYTCGKGGQYVPVGVGLPTVKLSNVTVGGSRVG